MRVKRAQAGFTFLELIIVIAIISTLVVFAIDRMLGLRVDAERVALRRNASAMQTAAVMQLSEYLVKRQQNQIREMAGANPVRFLQNPPAGYVGERANPDPNSIAPGDWYFDTADRVLVYRVVNAEYFQTPLPGPARVRFRLELAFDDENGNKVYDPGADTIRGLHLVQLDPYSWLRKPVASGIK